KAGAKKEDIACICFSAQMMGCLPVDRVGNPLRKSIIWADLRGVRQAEYIEKSLGMESVYRITGHRISASYSAAKILWIKDNQPELFKETFKVLHAKDFIIYRLTGKFVTDYSDASGMNLFDIVQKKWSQEILKNIGIPEDILPEPHASTDIAGCLTREAADCTGLQEGIPVVIGGGDGSCAAVGAGVVETGKTYNVVGSSSWVAAASKEPVFDPGMRTFNWVHLDPELYSPCGTMQTAGYSLKWLKDTLCGLEILQADKEGINPYKLIDEKIERTAPGANNLLFLPYLLGERSPRWNPDAKGAFVGLKMNHSGGDIYRSVLEGVGFNLKVILDIFESFLPVNEVIVIGGGAKGKVWMQIMADIWQKTILVPEYLEEATSMGAAICGGIGIGAYNDFNVVSQFNPVKSEIHPRAEYRAVYERLYTVFNKAYEALAPIYSML
ncbi:MAG: xylulokinase, partial [Bacteroidetes bacterium]